MSMPAARRNPTDSGADDSISELVSKLSAPNGLQRQRARRALTDIGRPAIPMLVRALGDRSWLMRWEAAKALSEMADLSTVEPLLAAMDDEKPEIRWLAAEGLSAIGRAAIGPLLLALVEKADQPHFRAGAHFVLRTLEERGIDGDIALVLDALEGIQPSIEAPLAAEEALVRMANITMLPRARGPLP